LAVFAWGFGPLFVKGMEASLPTIVLWRVLAAIPLAVGVAYVTGGRLSWSLLRRAFPTAVCFGLSFIFGFASFQETSIVNATLILALQPALVLIVASRMFGERRTRTELVWASAAFLGVVAVVADATAGESSLTGDLLAVGNLFLFTGYFLLAKRVRDDDVHSWSLLAAVFVDAAVVVVPWALVTEGELGTMTGNDWILIAGLVLIPGMVGHGLMTWTHHYVDVTVTSMITLANPVVSIVGAWIVFSEALGPIQVAGAIAVLVALGAILRRQRADRAIQAEATISGDLLDQ